VLALLAAEEPLTERLGDIVRQRLLVSMGPPGGAPAVDRYEIRELLGRGGMGEVWSARETATGREVAIKILVPTAVDDGNDAAVARFQREARLAAGLSHPRCVFVYASGSLGDRPFLVMERVAGCDLQAFLQANGPPPVPRALQWIADLATGLAHAHSLGVLHRDIKPSNAFLDGEGHAKLGDFGLATASHDNSLLTGRAFVGTALFAAPERLRGEPATTASDIFSLGVTAYVLLTGKPSFAASTWVRWPSS